MEFTTDLVDVAAPSGSGISDHPMVTRPCVRAVGQEGWVG